jgi:hypothetical protein
VNADSRDSSFRARSTIHRFALASRGEREPMNHWIPLTFAALPAAPSFPHFSPWCSFIPVLSGNSVNFIMRLHDGCRKYR